MVLIPKEDQFFECTATQLYGSRYVYYVIAGFGPPIFIIFLVIWISILTCFHLWKTYFKIRKIQPMPGTLARSKNGGNMKSNRIELDQKSPKRIPSHFINSELSTQERIEDLEGSSDDGDNRTSHIYPQDTNTKIMETEDSNETFIEIFFVSKEDTQYEPRFENGNINTQMEAGIFVPIDNDFNRFTLATRESSTRSQEDNREKTTKKGVFEDQSAIHFLKNDQNDQTTSSKRKNDVIQDLDQKATNSLMDDQNDQSSTGGSKTDLFQVDQEAMNFSTNNQNDQSTTDIFNPRHNNKSDERQMRRGLKQKFRFRRSWEVRAFVTSIVIAVQTIILTGPFISSFLIEIINGKMLTITTKFTLFFLYLANSLSNPIIYAWRIPEIRQEFRKLSNRNN
ncbi:Hypothetical predicted protein [Mytilus galloprovincialis]|uniref:G-protein coupled receptors family 1 profile domain-containing protein n=1 Tax=Mytilus galloprovincialis TaxID=29158 RepID=A0A8B6DF54_MYTGA|nr:Hypothetical predicted protein [Mytilus galloprovincialis]